MAKVQPLIHPILIQIINRFPGYNDTFFDLFRKIQSFNEICLDYEQCCRTLRHWQGQDTEIARQRTAEYQEILQGLHLEIKQYLKDK